MTQLRPQPVGLTYVSSQQEAEQRPLNLRIIARLMGYTKPYKKMRRWLIVASITRAIQLPLLAWMIGAAIKGPITHGDMTDTLFWTAGLLLVALWIAFNMRYRMLLALQLGEAVVHDLRGQIFRHLQRLSMSYFDKTKVGRIISRMTSDVEALRRGVQDVLFVTLVSGGRMIVAGAVMAAVDWVLFLVVLGLVPVIAWTNFSFRHRLSKAYRDVQESFSRVTATLAESVLGIRVTQGFVRQDRNAEIFSELVETHSEYHMTAARTSGIFVGLLQLNRPLFLALLLLVGGWRALTLNPAGEPMATVGDLILFFFLAEIFFEPITILAKQYDIALEAMAGAERVFHLLDTKPAVAEPEQPVDFTKAGGLRGHVDFKDLWFEYLPGTPVLKEITFTASPGQTIALVGHTGSGKTSIVNLIAKFYLPTQGKLLIDGHAIGDIASDELHHHMGIVLQQNFLFTGTVKDNIRVGKPGASDEQVIEAAVKLDCDDVLRALPQGFETEVGERGGNLSLGQQQLVCFCRAMLADPRILILDEATSAVDPMTEARVQRALHKLLKGRTSFVVAHRLSTIRDANQVLVLDHGRIIERGTHLELLATGGVYANLYRSFIRAGEGGER